MHSESDTGEECHPGGGGSVGEEYCQAKCIEGKQCHLSGGGVSVGEECCLIEWRLSCQKSSRSSSE